MCVCTIGHYSDYDPADVVSLHMSADKTIAENNSPYMYDLLRGNAVVPDEWDARMWSVRVSIGGKEITDLYR